MAQRENESLVQARWVNINYLAQDIASLRNVIAAGQDISAANINALVTLINNCVGHYHTYDDAYQLATFGNNGDRNNYYESKDTSTTGISSAPAVTAGNTITATDHNSIRNVAESLRTHSHGISDRTSA